MTASIVALFEGARRVAQRFGRLHSAPRSRLDGRRGSEPAFSRRHCWTVASAAAWREGRCPSTAGKRMGIGLRGGVRTAPSTRALRCDSSAGPPSESAKRDRKVADARQEIVAEQTAGGLQAAMRMAVSVCCMELSGGGGRWTNSLGRDAGMYCGTILNGGRRRKADARSGRIHELRAREE
jgi:hypothetical protein